MNSEKAIHQILVNKLLSVNRLRVYLFLVIFVAIRVAALRNPIVILGYPPTLPPSILLFLPSSHPLCFHKLPAHHFQRTNVLTRHPR